LNLFLHHENLITFIAFHSLLGFGHIALSEMSREQLLDEKLVALQAEDPGRVAKIDYALTDKCMITEQIQ
jgi:hypothetical protein